MKFKNNPGLRLEPKVEQKFILTPRLRRNITEEEIKARTILPKKPAR